VESQVSGIIAQIVVTAGAIIVVLLTSKREATKVDKLAKEGLDAAIWLRAGEQLVSLEQRVREIDEQLTETIGLLKQERKKNEDLEERLSAAAATFEALSERFEILSIRFEEVVSGKNGNGLMRE